MSTEMENESKINLIRRGANEFLKSDNAELAGDIGLYSAQRHFDTLSELEKVKTQLYFDSANLPKEEIKKLNAKQNELGQSADYLLDQAAKYAVIALLAKSSTLREVDIEN